MCLANQLTFIRHAEIETIKPLQKKDHVQLSMMGEHFKVSEMVNYMATELCDGLKEFLGLLLTIPADSDIRRDIRKRAFDNNFKDAVDEAYGGSSQTCQHVLSDFVWVAREWFLQDPVVEALVDKHPEFGRQVLTALIKGPQSPFVRADKKLMAAANKPLSALRAESIWPQFVESELCKAVLAFEGK